MKTYAKNSKNFIDKEEKLQKQRETFVTSLSHDLKNPTIAQIRALELLLKGNFGKIEPAQREILEMLLESCKYMNAMLRNVLTTYRSEKGIIHLASEKVSIKDLSIECKEEMVYLAQAKGVKILFNNKAEKEYVWGDYVQIKRVIMNLLSNSIKYAFSNTDIMVEVYNEPNFTCFKFENHSSYLTLESQKKIFAKYVSLSKDISGTGLGLYASKKIVEAHGGNMFVESFIEGKNIFGFRIPNGDETKDKEKTVAF